VFQSKRHRLPIPGNNMKYYLVRETKGKHYVYYYEDEKAVHVIGTTTACLIDAPEHVQILEQQKSLDSLHEILNKSKTILNEIEL